MHKPLEITGKLLTRNWIFNLAGQVLPLLVALATIPYVIRRLGAERFGILSIAWVLLGYLGLFDLGLGRATTKFVAECLGRDEIEKLPALVWTSIGSQALFGMAGSIVAAAVIPFLVNHALKLSTAVRGETRLTFYILAGCLPLVFLGNGLRGVLEAGQHFDVVNYVKIPANASVFLLPAIALPFGAGLPGIVLLLALSRLAASIAFLFFCLRLFPVMRVGLSWDRALLRSLLGYGGWVTVSNVVSPLLTYMDRFFIGSMISVAAVGFYTAPYEAVTRAWVIPNSLIVTVFPAFSSLYAARYNERLEELCARSLKSLLLILSPILLLVISFAQEILKLWLGPEFAAKGTLVLQLLAAGVLINSLAFVPFALLQGLGRPDLSAKVHLLELPFYAAVLTYCLRHMGIAGAAMAWTLRVAADTLLMFGAVSLLRTISVARLLGNGVLRAAITVCGFGVSLALPAIAGNSLWLRCMFSVALVLVFGMGSWKFLFDNSDRNLVLSAADRLRTALPRAR
jgi:O-antigen/teichoic acid export membrane protein